MEKDLDQEQTARLAYQFWLERGCPVGSPEQDWFRAEDELRARGRNVLIEKDPES